MTSALLELDTRDVPAAPAEGVHVRLTGEWYPPAWDVVSPFGRVSAEASTYVSAGDPPAVTLALRAGGARVSGTVPLQDMVYVGGETTLRGYAEQRFAGRSGAYANAELRLFAGRLSLGDVGVFGRVVRPLARRRGRWGVVCLATPPRRHGLAGRGKEPGAHRPLRARRAHVLTEPLRFFDLTARRSCRSSPCRAPRNRTDRCPPP